MSSKRRLRRNGCTGKVAFKSFREALDVARMMVRRGNPGLDAYLCPIRAEDRQPRHYHVGHHHRADWAVVP